MTSALPRAFTQRGKTQTEIDRENFEKFQTVSIQKAINVTECPVKEKHVRTAIIGTFQDGGGAMFWTVVEKLQLQANPIVCWKFCYTLHKILRDGHPSAIPESQKYIGKLTELGKLWGHLKDSYGKLIKLYTKLLIQKLSFHKKYGQIPGNLKLDDDEFAKIIGRDVDAQFEVSVDMMDYMDDIIALQAGVFGSLDMSRSNSMTASGQCRLAPLVQCILESALLYDYIVKLLFKLHSSLSADTLAGHRTRFAQQFTALKQFFYNSKNLQYYKNLIHVPTLPEQAPNFLIASELSQHARPVAAVVPEAAEESLVDTSEPRPPAVPDRFDSMARFSDDDKRDKRMHDMKHEMEALRRRMRQMEGDSHLQLNQRTEELRRRAKEVETLRAQLDQLTNQRDELMNEKQQLADELESRVDTAQKQSQASDDKFKKMKDIYNKLREDHVNLLRTNGETQKLIKKLKADDQAKDEQIRELAGQVDLAKNERSMLQEAVQQSGVNNEELVAVRTSVLQLEQEKEELQEKLQTAQEAKSTADLQVSHGEELVKELEMAKMNLESQVRELEEKVSDYQINQTSLDGSVQLLQSQMADLTQREQTVKASLSQAESRIAEYQTEKENLEANIRLLTEQNAVDLRNKEATLMKQCLSECSQVIRARMDMLDDPSVCSVRCSPDFLIELLLEPALNYLNNLKDSLSGQDWLTKVHDLVHGISDCLLFVKATSHSSPDEFGEDLSNLSTGCGAATQDLITSLQALLDDPNADTVSTTQVLEDKLKQVKTLVEKVRPKIKDVKAEEIGELVEQEMASTTSAIEEAAKNFEELLAQSRSKDSGVQLEVNERIIDSCTQLMQNIRVLIEKSITLQKEIVATGRGAASVHDFYKKHSRWTEGLLSAAKSVAFAANTLLESADKVVRGEGKFEELIVCSQEIAACTTQLVVASQVKADAQSKALQDLKKASTGVTTSTGNVVAQAKSCAEIRDEQVLQDLSQITLTQAKRLEMNAQVKVLELESALNQERVRLAALRKKHYQLGGESEGWDEEDINNAS